MRSLAVAALVAVALPGAASAQLLEQEEPPVRSPFDRGRFSLGISLGTQSAFGERYIAAGGGVGYFVLSGLEIGVSGEKWFGGDGPSVANATPSVRYVAVFVPGPVKPFAATFYNHWFIGDEIDDVDAVGGTLGIVWHQGGGFVLSIGATVEHIVSECADDCTDVYPALGVSIAL